MKRDIARPPYRGSSIQAMYLNQYRLSHMLLNEGNPQSKYISPLAYGCSYHPPRWRRLVLQRVKAWGGWGGGVGARRGSLYLSLPLIPGQLHLLQHLGPLLHDQGLLVGEGRDVAVVLRGDKRNPR